MPLWGSKDQANNAPKFKIKAKSPNTGIQLFGVSVAGIDDGEMQTKANAGAHAGWQQIRRGFGQVSSITITAPGTGYANTDTIKVTGQSNSSAQSTPATATVVTNGSGALTALTITNNGLKFCNNSTTTVSVLNANTVPSSGTGATFSFVLGGRANRVQVETLISLSSMTANNSTV